MSCYLCLLLSILFSAVSSVSFEYMLKEDVMYIIIGEEIFPISLNESPITKELLSILPLKIRQIQTDSTKIKMPLNANIEATSYYPSENNVTEANKGDIILYKGKEIIIFNESTNISSENGNYIIIGTCENSEELIKKIKKNKTLLLWNTLNYENHKRKVKPYGNYNSIMNFFTWKIFTFFCFLLI